MSGKVVGECPQPDCAGQLIDKGRQPYGMHRTALLAVCDTCGHHQQVVID